MNYTTTQVSRRMVVLGALGGGAAMLAGAILPAQRAAAATATSMKAAASLGPLINIAQTWNNCGPSSVAEVLAYWGIQRSQYQVQTVLRADGDPSGMGPYGVPSYMRSLGMRALLGVGGTEQQIKALINRGFPVIVDQYVSLSDRTGHYRPIQAYDDRTRQFVSSDPYLGADHLIGYDEFEAIWQSNNRRFMVLYPAARHTTVTTILAETGWNNTATAKQDLAYQQQLLTQGVPDTSGEGGAKNYYLNMAWDQLQLGQYQASRLSLSRAQSNGASPIATSWIGTEVALAVRA